MNTILHIALLTIIFSNSIFLMLGKNILRSKILKISWAIALIDILLIYFYFSLTKSIILYIVFTSIIVVFSMGLRTVVKEYSSTNLANNFKNHNRKRFANFFVYFLLFFLIMLTIGVMKNLLFDSPVE